jgi:hypothetical protein
MGNLKIWFIFGFEKWGNLKPAYHVNDKGICFKPLCFGLWIRWNNKKIKVTKEEVIK